MKKLIRSAVAGMIALSLAAAPMGKAYAEEETGDGTQEMTLEEQLQASYDVKPDSNSIQGWPQGPQIYGHSAIVMDMDSGAVLYEKAADDQHYPASITKLLTALVALENSQPDDEVYFSEDSVAFMEYGDASIGMTPGEILSMNDALYGMLLASANEVSYAIAESVGKLMGGDYNTFIQAMNDRSAELGCTGSHWMNANGLHDEQHYTTARDMALIASAVYQFDEFRTVTQTLNYTIGPTNLVNESRTFQQNHKMLWPENYYYYEYCTGGKTGYTDQSRTTLVTMAEKDGLRLAAVILQDDGDVYVDTRAMFDYAYGNFSKTALSSQTLPEEIASYSDPDAYVLLPTGAEFADLDYEIVQDETQPSAGTITFTYNGQNVGSAPVTLSESYLEKLAGEDENTGEAPAGGTDADTGKDSQTLPFPVMLLAGVAAVIVILAVAVTLMRMKMRLDRQRKKRRRRSGGHHPASDVQRIRNGRKALHAGVEKPAARAAETRRQNVSGKPQRKRGHAPAQRTAAGRNEPRRYEPGRRDRTGGYR